MLIDKIALFLSAIVSMGLPIVVLGILIAKHKQQTKSVLLLFVCGGLIYFAMQWGVKEHGLTWLFNHTSFSELMKTHYLVYLFVVALAGAILTVTMQVLCVGVIFKRKLTVTMAFAFAIGYNFVESTLLIGIKSMNSIIGIFRNEEATLEVTTPELFLSSYERLLILIIEISIVVVLVYLVQRKMPVKGFICATICDTFLAFIPGFFIAFTLPDYLEIFSRSIALTMVYVILTATAITGLVILNACKNLIDE